MPGLIVLQCPTCGGGLEAAGDTLRLACPHCANQYLLDRRVAEIEPIERTALRPSVTSTTTLGQWLQVAGYAIRVHSLTEARVGDDRVVYADLEVRNPTDAPLKCRHDQWIVFDQHGYTYEATKDFSHPTLYEQNGRRYLGSTRTLTPGMRLRGWLAYVLPTETAVEVFQFCGGSPERSAEFRVTIGPAVPAP